MITIAALSIGGLVPLLVQLAIVGLILWLILWFIGYVGIPEPFGKAARVIVAIVGLVYLVNLLLGISGNAFLIR